MLVSFSPDLTALTSLTMLNRSSRRNNQEIASLLILEGNAFQSLIDKYELSYGFV